VIAAVSNNAVGSGPYVFVGGDGLPNAFVLLFKDDVPGFDLVRCEDADCTTSQATWLAGLSGYPALEPLVLVDGTPAGVALSEDGALELVVCSDAQCGTASVTQLADGAEMWNTSFTDDGRLVVMYGLPWGNSPEPPGTALVACTDASCTAAPQVSMLGELWSPDSQFSHIAVDGDRLAYAYRTGDAAVFLVTCSDLTCDDMSAVEVVTAAGDNGWLDVFGLDIGSDGLPVIAYGWMGDPRELRFIHCENWECSDRQDVAVHELHGYWQGPSLAIGSDGLPVMAYTDNERITVAKCEDAACSTAVISTPLGDTPGAPSLTVGPEGNPVVAYYVEDPNPIDYEQNPDIPMPPPVPALFRCADLACSAPAD
jgi:hypothetical protein